MQAVYVSDLGEVMRVPARGQANPDGSAFSIGGERFWLRGKETDPRTGKIQGVYSGDRGTIKKGTFFETIGRERAEQPASFSVGQDSPAVADLRARLARFRSKTTDPMLDTAEAETTRRMNIYAERKGIDLSTHEGLRQALSDISAGRDEERPDMYDELVSKYCSEHKLDPADYDDRRTAIIALQPALNHIAEAKL